MILFHVFSSTMLVLLYLIVSILAQDVEQDEILDEENPRVLRALRELEEAMSRTTVRSSSN